jgi:hypothetical protein
VGYGGHIPTQLLCSHIHNYRVHIFGQTQYNMGLKADINMLFNKKHLYFLVKNIVRFIFTKIK